MQSISQLTTESLVVLAVGSDETRVHESIASSDSGNGAIHGQLRMDFRRKTHGKQNRETCGLGVGVRPARVLPADGPCAVSNGLQQRSVLCFLRQEIEKDQEVRSVLVGKFDTFV